MAGSYIAGATVAPKHQHMPGVSPATPRPLPLFKVLLHNDDINFSTDVALIIRRLTPLSEGESIRRTKEAHDTGVALLLVTHKERAELYVEQFASCRIIVTIEPDA